METNRTASCQWKHERGSRKLGLWGNTNTQHPSTHRVMHGDWSKLDRILGYVVKFQNKKKTRDRGEDRKDDVISVVSLS